MYINNILPFLWPQTDTLWAPGTNKCSCSSWLSTYLNTATSFLNPCNCWGLGSETFNVLIATAPAEPSITMWSIIVFHRDFFPNGNNPQEVHSHAHVHIVVVTQFRSHWQIKIVLFAHTLSLMQSVTTYHMLVTSQINHRMIWIG